MHSGGKDTTQLVSALPSKVGILILKQLFSLFELEKLYFCTIKFNSTQMPP